MNTKLEYKNNILYIIIYGILIGSKTKEFESTIIPIIFGLRTSKVMINMNYIDLIDKKGIDSIIIKDPNPTNIEKPLVYIYNSHQLENYSSANYEAYNVTP
ncbi:MAG: hypothetical protein IJ966_00470, partial [Bacilli bacterium]|nr:hypothetical protein [Bacilli bacterium]